MFLSEERQALFSVGSRLIQRHSSTSPFALVRLACDVMLKFVEFAYTTTVKSSAYTMTFPPSCISAADSLPRPSRFHLAELI